MFWFLLFNNVNVMAQNKNGRPAPKEIKVPKGLIYKVKHYREGKFTRASEMDISYKEDGNKKKPVIVFIHGGGWTKGDNDQVAWQVFGAAQQGFVAISISYRLLSEAPFPACIEDVKQAIRYLKSLKNELPIDVKRIGVWGYSAGAHLALMVALSPDEEFKTASYNNYNANIKTVMAVSAPTDFVARVKDKGTLTILSKYQNTSMDFLESISPISYINKNQIPVYMLHGTSDPIVKPFHYKNFEKKIHQTQVTNFKLFEFKEAGHMFYFRDSKNVKPIFQEFLQSI